MWLLCASSLTVLFCLLRLDLFRHSELAGNALSGILPHSLGSLTSLQFLYDAAQRGML
jgi:hypothetical protein